MHFSSLYFDLDDTLYPASSGLWEAIRERMNSYMQHCIDLPLPEIVRLRQGYLEKYGTTLRGLQAHYQVDTDEYLAYVHDLPLEQFIQPDPNLRKLLLSLPQRRWIFTNADGNHARRVTKILGIEDCFTGIIDIRAIDFACKPDKIAYQRALAITGDDDPSRCIIFDDALRNLAPAREMGFFTVLVGKNGSDHSVDRSIKSLDDLRDCMTELWDVDGQVGT
ncbi:MAG: pyrimidine 5'-nucleotidase [Anaerolineales bacterium]